MTRTDIINEYIRKNNYQTYLELGTDNRTLNFNKIKCPHKYCVDINPAAEADFTGSTDNFFKQNIKKWDIIFVDAMHEEKQVIKDIDNSLAVLSPGGTIIVHDCNPTTKTMQEVPRREGVWTGNVWKAWLHFRANKDLSMRVIDTDFGVGIIQIGKQKPLVVENPTYETFAKNKKQWLNLKGKERISICIPTYEQKGHGFKMITQLLNTILRQEIDYDYEIIVSDNSQDDKIKDVCKAFEEELPINYYTSDRFGVSANTNNAISKAQYEFIKIMYMDDLFTLKNSINLFVETLKKNDWAISNSIHIDGHGTIKGERYSDYDHSKFDKNRTGMPSVIAFRKCDIVFDETLKTVLDMYFYYQLYELYGEPGKIHETAVAQRYWNGSVSANQPSMLRKEINYLRQNKMIHS